MLCLHWTQPIVPLMYHKLFKKNVFSTTILRNYRNKSSKQVNPSKHTLKEQIFDAKNRVQSSNRHATFCYAQECEFCSPNPHDRDPFILKWFFIPAIVNKYQIIFFLKKIPSIQHVKRYTLNILLLHRLVGESKIMLKLLQISRIFLNIICMKMVEYSRTIVCMNMVEQSRTIICINMVE